ncbi:MAG: hypothetical protein NC328_00060 [Muribaculum sp.]|nr:hypothetical protein [Muribaculum sp.]
MKKLFLLISLLCLSAPACFASDQSSISSDSVPGKFVWVPDSLSQDVDKLLEGHSKVVLDSEKLDLSETVVYKGDTIPMVLKDRNLGRYDRGLFNWLFIPKGSWHFGLTASYGEFSTSDLEMFDILDDIDLGAHSFSIRPFISYFIRNNLSVGVRMSYNTTKANIDSFKVDIDEDMNFNLHDIAYRNESYSTALILNQYIGIARLGRFGVTNEVSLEFSSGNSSFRRPFAGVPKETHTTYMDARLNFSPGVCVFIMKNVSFNLSFGVFGFYLRNEKQTVDGEALGNRFTSGANFKFNIFNIAMGIGVHI